MRLLGIMLQKLRSVFDLFIYLLVYLLYRGLFPLRETFMVTLSLTHENYHFGVLPSVISVHSIYKKRQNFTLFSLSLSLGSYSCLGRRVLPETKMSYVDV